MLFLLQGYPKSFPTKRFECWCEYKKQFAYTYRTYILIPIYICTILYTFSRPHNKSVYSCIPKFPQKYVPACLGQSSSSCQYVLCVIIGVSDHDLLIGDGVCLKVRNPVQLRDGGIVGGTMWYCSGTCGHATVWETVNFTKAILQSIEN